MLSEMHPSLTSSKSQEFLINIVANNLTRDGVLQGTKQPEAKTWRITVTVVLISRIVKRYDSFLTNSLCSNAIRSVLLSNRTVHSSQAALFTPRSCLQQHNRAATPLHWDSNAMASFSQRSECPRFLCRLVRYSNILYVDDNVRLNSYKC
jgi:hypothetical protein